VVVAVHVIAAFERVNQFGLLSGAKSICCIGEKQPLASFTIIWKVCVSPFVIDRQRAV
jgi:hypothetical protein